MLKILEKQQIDYIFNEISWGYGASIITLIIIWICRRFLRMVLSAKSFVDS
jgi:hypothetical protein